MLYFPQHKLLAKLSGAIQQFYRVRNVIPMTTPDPSPKSISDIFNVPVPQVRIPRAPQIPQMPEFPNVEVRRNPLLENIEDNYASEFYKRLAVRISEFNAGLDDAHEVGVRLVNFGQTVVFYLEDMGYWNPSLISFQGRTEDGQPVELIQHVNQISVLLMKLPRENPSEPKRPIGFHFESDSDER